MRRPIKAEVLLSRRCDLRCPHCGIIRSDVEEKSPEYWRDALTALHGELGVAFFPIYGGEPLVYGDLLKLTRYLSEAGLAFSYISNSLKLYDRLAMDLMDAGLKSWTVSVDTLSTGRIRGRSLRLRNFSALEAIDLFRALGLPDIQAQATISPFNMAEIPAMVRHFSDMDVWFSFDVIHGSKSDELDPASKVVPESSMTGDHQQFGSQHYEGLRELSEALLELRRGGAKIYQNEAIIKMLADPDYSVFRKWTCSEYDYPAFLSINSDGSLMACDDMEHPSLSQFDALTVADHYEDFVECWRGVVATCRGCWWTTHVSAFMGQEPKHVQHKELQE